MIKITEDGNLELDIKLFKPCKYGKKCLESTLQIQFKNLWFCNAYEKYPSLKHDTKRR